MSDVGLGANLELDITAALRRVDQLGRAIETASAAVIQVDTTSVAPEITRAVDAADTGILVESDTTGVAGEITSAVDAADTGILVTADAADVTGSIDSAVDAADTQLSFFTETGEITSSIDSAVDAADTQLTLFGDASDITGAITAAIDNADTAVVVTGTTEITGDINAAVENANTSVDVDGAVSPQLGADVANLGASLADASDEGEALTKVIGALSIGAAVAGLRSLADAASDLAESTSKARVVFGTEFPAIERFAVGAADAVGLSTQAAFEAAGTFGNLFQALGTSRAEAARLSPQVVQLAGDLASFNNIGTDEALEKLRSGLVGEIEPLRQLGVSFNALDVEAKALELGLGGVGRELTEGEKVQARYALIVDQTALAQGDFARTSDGLANQQRILRAEFQNTAAAAGAELLPAFMSLIDEVRRVLPDLSQLAEDVLPAVGAALANLGPLIGVSVDLLVALAPAIEVVAGLLASIPDEAIAVGAGLLIANKAFGVLGGLLTGVGPALVSVPGIMRGVASAAPAAASGVGALGGGVQGLAASVAALNPLTLAAGVFAVGLFSEWQRGREVARDYREELDQLGSSLETVDGFQQLTTAGVAKYVREQSRINTKDQVKDLTELGISYEQIANFAQRGARGHLDFVDALVEGGDLTRVTRDEYGELVTATGRVIDANSKLGKSLEDVGVNGSDLVVGNTDLVKSYDEIESVTEDVAKRQISLLQAQGLLTDAQVRTALGTNASGEATVAYAEALNELEPLVVASIRAAEETVAKYGPLADVFLETGDALARLGSDAPEVAAAIASVAREGSDPTSESLIGLASILDGAKLSEEQMADAALALGTDVATLGTFIEDTTAAIDGFVQAGVDGLPAIADAFNDANKDSQVSAQEFVNGLLLETTKMAQFIADLAVITEEGFAEVAGRLSEQGVETAGLAASELANAARAGNTVLLEETQAGLDARDSVIALSTAFLTDVLGPEYVAATGQVGTLASEALATTFTPEEQTRIKMELAALELDENGRRVAAIAALVGADAAGKYGATLGLDDATIAAAVAAGEAIIANAPAAAFRMAGEAAMDGFIEGMSNRGQAAADKAAQLAVRSAKAARDALEPGSPSRLTARLIGVPFAQGIIAGMDAEAESVVAAAERIVREAAGVAVVAPEVSLAASGVGSASSSTGTGALEVVFGPGSVVVHAAPGMTTDEAREIGAGVIDGAEERIAERRLSILGRTV